MASQRDREMPQMRIRLPQNLKNADAPNPTYPRGAIVMVAGAGGGFSGPAGMYPELSQAVSAYPNLIAVQTDYRFPGELKPCVQDTISTLDMLANEYNCERAVIVGWSFGGAVVITAGAAHPLVKGIATVASQTAGTDDVGRLSGQGKACLFIHGEADTCLPPRCSQQLYSLAGEPKEIVLYENDNHSVTLNKEEARSKIESFIISLLTKP